MLKYCFWKSACKTISNLSGQSIKDQESGQSDPSFNNESKVDQSECPKEFVVDPPQLSTLEEVNQSEQPIDINQAIDDWVQGAKVGKFNEPYYIMEKK